MATTEREIEKIDRTKISELCSKGKRRAQILIIRNFNEKQRNLMINLNFEEKFPNVFIIVLEEVSENNNTVHALNKVLVTKAYNREIIYQMFNSNSKKCEFFKKRKYSETLETIQISSIIPREAREFGIENILFALSKQKCSLVDMNITEFFRCLNKDKNELSCKNFITNENFDLFLFMLFFETEISFSNFEFFLKTNNSEIISSITKINLVPRINDEDSAEKILRSEYFKIIFLNVIKNNNYSFFESILKNPKLLSKHVDFKTWVEAREIANDNNFFKILFKLHSFEKEYYEENINKEIEKLHENIQNSNIHDVAIFVEKYPFFKVCDKKHISALEHAVDKKQFEIYSFLLCHNFLSANLNKKITSLSVLEKNAIRDANLKNVQNTSFFKSENFQLNYKFFNTSGKNNDMVEELCTQFSKRRELKEILNVASKLDFKIIFDFNSENVLCFDPNLEQLRSGNFYPNEKITLVTKVKSKQELYGTFVHELCHLVFFCLYENNCLPYLKHDAELETVWEKVFREVKKISTQNNLNGEESIKSVFKDVSKKENQKAELAVRVPYILAHNFNDGLKIIKLKEKYKTLFDFFKNKVMPDFELTSNVKFLSKLQFYKSIDETKLCLKNTEHLKFLYFPSTNFKKVLIPSNAPLLTICKISNELQTLSESKFDIKFKNLFIDFQKLLNFSAEITKNRNITRLIVYCEKMFDKKHLKFFQMLYEHLEIFFVFLLENESSVDPLLAKKFDFEIIESDKIKFDDLTEEHQEKILKSDIYFNDEIYHFSNFSNGIEIIEKNLAEIFLTKNIEINFQILKENKYTIHRKIFGPENTLYLVKGFLEKVKNEKIILILGGPGYGKTTLLKIFHQILCENFPSFFIHFVPLGQISFSKTCDVESFVVDQLIKLNDLEQCIFLMKYKEGKVKLILDGLDEIDPKNREKVFELLKKDFKNQFYISARSHLEHDIKRMFKNNFIYRIVPLNEHEQINFLMQMWNDRESIDKIKNLAVKLIQTNSIYQNMMSLKILGEFIEKNYLKHESVDIFDVYDNFLGFHKHKNYSYELFALNYLLEDYPCYPYDENDLKELFRDCLKTLDPEENNACFYQKNLLEYLAAKFVIENINNDFYDNFPNIFIRVLKEEKFYAVRMFLNEKILTIDLNDKNGENVCEELRKDFTFMVRLREENFTNITFFLLISLNFHNRELLERVLKEEEILSNLFELIEGNDKLTENFMESFLEVFFITGFSGLLSDPKNLTSNLLEKKFLFLNKQIYLHEGIVKIILNFLTKQKSKIILQNEISTEKDILRLFHLFTVDYFMNDHCNFNYLRKYKLLKPLKIDIIENSEFLQPINILKQDLKDNAENLTFFFIFYLSYFAKFSDEADFFEFFLEQHENGNSILHLLTKLKNKFLSQHEEKNWQILTFIFTLLDRKFETKTLLTEIFRLQNFEGKNFMHIIASKPRIFWDERFFTCLQQNKISLAQILNNSDNKDFLPLHYAVQNITKNENENHLGLFLNLYKSVFSQAQLEDILLKKVKWSHDDEVKRNIFDLLLDSHNFDHANIYNALISLDDTLSEKFRFDEPNENFQFHAEKDLNPQNLLHLIKFQRSNDNFTDSSIDKIIYFSQLLKTNYLGRFFMPENLIPLIIYQVEAGTVESLNLTIRKLEKFLSNDDFREILSLKTKNNENLLHLALKKKDEELVLFFRNLFQEYFTKEEIRNIFKYPDSKNKIPLHRFFDNLKNSPNEIYSNLRIILRIYQELFSKNEINEFLTMKVFLNTGLKGNIFEYLQCFNDCNLTPIQIELVNSSSCTFFTNIDIFMEILQSRATIGMLKALWCKLEETFDKKHIFILLNWRHQSPPYENILQIILKSSQDFKIFDFILDRIIEYFPSNSQIQTFLLASDENDENSFFYAVKNENLKCFEIILNFIEISTLKKELFSKILLHLNRFEEHFIFYLVKHGSLSHVQFFLHKLERTFSNKEIKEILMSKEISLLTLMTYIKEIKQQENFELMKKYLENIFGKEHKQCAQTSSQKDKLEVEYNVREYMDFLETLELMFKAVNARNFDDELLLNSIKGNSNVLKINLEKVRKTKDFSYHEIKNLEEKVAVLLNECNNKVEKSLLIAVSGLDERHCFFLWQLKETNKLLYLSLEIDENYEEIKDFIEKILFNALENGKTGLDHSVNLERDIISQNMSLMSLFDERGYTLLMQAAEIGNLNLVNYMIKNGLNVNHRVNGLVAIDLVKDTAANYDSIVLNLLKENSPFPRTFDRAKAKDELLKFLTDMEAMHNAVKKENKEEILKLISEYKRLKFFFVPNSWRKYKNVSAKKLAKERKSEKVLKIFNDEIIVNAIFEIFDSETQNEIDHSRDEGLIFSSIKNFFFGRHKS